MNPAKDKPLYIFDIGNVVLGNISMLHRISEEFGLPYDDFKRDYHHYLHPMMDGVVSVPDYLSHVHSLFGIQVPPDLFEITFTPCVVEGIRELIGNLRERGRRVVAGSNTFEPHEKVIERMGVFSLFDAVYLSHRLGLSKPFPAFFESILSSESCVPDEVVFIDDMQENIDAAAALGIEGILFDQRRQRVSELESLLL